MDDISSESEEEDDSDPRPKVLFCCRCCVLVVRRDTLFLSVDDFGMRQFNRKELEAAPEPVDEGPVDEGEVFEFLLFALFFAGDDKILE